MTGSVTVDELGAMALFTTRPSDRALAGWMSHEVQIIERMTEQEIDDYASG